MLIRQASGRTLRVCIRYDGSCSTRLLLRKLSDRKQKVVITQVSDHNLKVVSIGELLNTHSNCQTIN